MLWCRTLLDLVKTATLERLATIKGKEFMFKKSFMEMCSRSTVLMIALAISAFVFLVVVGASVLITLLLPEVYAGSARIKVELVAFTEQNLATSPSYSNYDPYLIQTEFEVIQSEVILDKVIEKLNLNETYGKKFNAGSKLKTAESRMLLKRQIELRPVRNTTLIEIRAYSDDKKEAASIANKVAEVYHQYRADQFRELMAVNAKQSMGTKVQIIDRAEPGIKPVRPNRPLNIFIGMIIGTAAGGGAGLLFLVVATLRKPKTMA
jgi:capsular polysaccharide biosynthesis protein